MLYLLFNVLVFFETFHMKEYGKKIYMWAPQNSKNWSADVLSGWTFCQEDVLSGPA